jgi:hypothetical protein
MKLDSQCKRECLDCQLCKYAHLCAKLMRVKYISKPKVRTGETNTKGGDDL